MNKKEQGMYVLIGILAGVLVVLGVLFFIYSGKMTAMTAQTREMEKTMKEALAQAEGAGEDGMDSASVDSEYVDVSGEEPKEEKKEDKGGQTSAEEKAKPVKKQEEEGEVDAATQFDALEPQIQTLIDEYTGQVGGTWSVYVEDLATGGSMSIQEEKMEAASLIKLYIMGAVYEQYDSLKEANGSIDELLNKMITVSDNEAANELVKILGEGDEAKGMSVVNAFCTQYNYNSTAMGRLLLAGSTVNDNYTSAADCGKFLKNVYNEKFTHWEDMLNLLKSQTLTTKIPAGIPDGVVVANKTGELEDVQNDAAIVFGEKCTYVVCIMAQGVSGTEGPVNGISMLSQAIYGYTNQT